MTIKQRLEYSAAVLEFIDRRRSSEDDGSLGTNLEGYLIHRELCELEADAIADLSWLHSGGRTASATARTTT